MALFYRKKKCQLINTEGIRVLIKKSSFHSLNEIFYFFSTNEWINCWLMEVKSIRKKVDKELNSCIVLKEYHLENSLEILFLGLLAFTAEGPGLIPGGGTKIPQAVQWTERKKGISHRLFLVKECHCALKRSACCPSNIHVPDDMDTKLTTILLT